MADRRSGRLVAGFAGGRDDVRPLALIVLGSAAVAWLAMVVLHGGDGSSILDHHRLGGSGAPEPGATEHAGHHPAAGTSVGELTASAFIVLAGWSVMVLAMMVPPALPMLSTVSRLVSRRRNPRLLLGLGVGTFLAAWTAVGAVLITADAGLHAITADLGPSWHVSALVPGVVLMGAGAYQLSPLKDRCLRACRSPRSFALRHWRGQRAPAAEVMTLTGAYALSCIGCCWALMAVSFAVGVAALPAMVVLALFMAAERLVPWGRRLPGPAGVLLIVVGVTTAIRPFLPA